MRLTGHGNRRVGNEYNYTIQTSLHKQLLAALTNETELCKAVKLFRTYAGITQQQLAELVGCSKTQITRIEGGRYNEIRSAKYITAVCIIMLQLTGIAFDAEPYLNRAPQPNNKTGVRGVCYAKGCQKFIATICLHQKRFHLGKYNTLDEAVHVRLKAEKIIASGLDAFTEWLKQNKS